MTDSIDHLKAIARSFSNASSDTGYSYSQILELCAKAVAGSESWNHFKADPPGKIKPDLTIPVLLERLDNAFTVAPVETKHFGHWFHTAYERWIIGAELISILLGEHKRGCSALMVCLKACPDLAELGLPVTILDGEQVSIINSPDIPAFDKARMIISGWYYENSLRPGKSEHRDAWYQYSVLAEERGHSPEAVSLYRSICRESFNHGWSLQSMIALGLLGSNPSAKLLQLDSTQLIDDLNQLWQYEEPEAFSP
ncbi:hypothetical protein [Maricurvus nonylphenolicus]|uniref:hypothetical protein n=1 Tax=Maricurvus nonylphenolicus TaxID=1008307 RepID=UPI0036F21044